MILVFDEVQRYFGWRKENKVKTFVSSCAKKKNLQIISSFCPWSLLFYINCWPCVLLPPTRLMKHLWLHQPLMCYQWKMRCLESCTLKLRRHQTSEPGLIWPEGALLTWWQRVAFKLVVACSLSLPVFCRSQSLCYPDTHTRTHTWKPPFSER